MSIRDGDVKRNIARGILLSKDVAKMVDFVVFPEMWTTGYDFSVAREFAEGEGQGWSRRIIEEFAREHGVYVVSSVPLLEDGKLYDAAMLINPDGRVIGVYKKLHLFRPYKEHEVFTPGQEIGLFETKFGKVGIAICYDLRFPELFRLMAKAGAKVIFVPASWGAPRALQWKTLLRARAAENQIFMVGVNRVGYSEATGETYSGDSAVYDPFGFELVHGEEVEQVLIADLDLKAIERVRSRLPLWQDRRTDKYGLWSTWGISD